MELISLRTKEGLKIAKAKIKILDGQKGCNATYAHKLEIITNKANAK